MEARAEMMRSIEEEDNKDAKSQGSNDFFRKDKDGERDAESKLNMAELKEQHKKLQEKIEESKQKVIEKELKRKRKPS